LALTPSPALSLCALHPDLEEAPPPIDKSVSVVIPTLNAGREFAWLLRKLYGQKGLKALDIVVVDSGSTDGTVELASAAGCKLIEIAARDFSHSFARNTGAAAARGDFLLFMVQDAYPIGDYWAYGMLRFLLEHADKSLAGVSCSEFSRSDSDMMYDSMINTHYSFLGCLERDRIGEYRGDDHVSLRSYGQLSDVSCLMSRELFERYQYRGDYAEDLDLGIRLLKSGYRVAMLASVKVVHSHNRQAFYYLKRSFVDVVFLVGMFEDFPRAPVESTCGLITGIVSTAVHLSQWFASFDDHGSRQILHVELAGLLGHWQKELLLPRLGEPSRLGDSRLDAYVDELRSRHLIPRSALDRVAEREFRQFVNVFLARLEHFNGFARGVYLEQDGFLRHEFRDVVRKTFAAAVGASLGYLYLARKDHGGPERELVEGIKAELQAGI
jgi:glycosyltransferase involved in cell wall biosynthesis